MNKVLLKIKRLIIKGSYRFTFKAESERVADGLTQEDVLEAILNATSLRSKRSRSKWKHSSREKVYIIESRTYDGILVYSKGAIRKQQDEEVFYIIISSKRAIV